MLNPSIGKLINHTENRYRLVLDIAKRARRIASDAEENKEIILDKPVSLAIDVMAKEKNL